MDCDAHLAFFRGARRGGGCAGDFPGAVVNFSLVMSRGVVRCACPNPHTGLQVSTCSDYD